MIGRLVGIVESLGSGQAIVDVNGVGYLINCSSKTLAVAETGKPVRLEVETQVREDAIVLYAFAASGEKTWFKLLTSVQGVGGRVALQILSALSQDELAAAILSDDRKTVSRAEGVGPKLAQRIISVLKDRVLEGGTASPTFQADFGSNTDSQAGKEHAEAISALVNLGYGRSEAFSAVSRAVSKIGSEASLSELLTASLKEAAGS